MSRVVKNVLISAMALSLVGGIVVPVVHADTPSVTESVDAYGNGQDTNTSKLASVIKPIQTVSTDTLKGVDLTSYQAEKNAGVQYKDFDGNVLSDEDFMKFLAKQGVNYVALKVAVNPANAEGKTYGAGDPTLKNAINTAKLAKAAGLKVNVDFVYSDFTSGNKAPKDWPTDMTQLQSKVTDYTQASLQALKDADAMPDMVTVGSNLGEDFLGQKDLPNIATLIGTATAAIRKADEKIKIAVNFAKPSGDWTTSIAQALKDANVDYDIFGVTIFPAWDKLSDIADAQKAVESTFNKKFAVMSVSYPFTAQDSDGKDNGSTASDVAQNLGEVSPQGQATYMHELYKQLTATDSASGAFYDNANWIATVPGNSGDAWQKNQDNAEKFGTGWATTAGAGYVDGADQWAGANSVDNQALFDDLGQPLQSLKMFAQMTPSEDNPVAGNDDSAANVLKPTKPADPFEVGTDTGLKDQKVNFTKLPGVNNQTIRGVDISSYTALKNAGVKFYDFNGQQASLLKVLADSGVNYIRLRIWNDPTNDDGDTYGGGASDVANELKIAKEAKKFGMKVLLDFHYSDFWADPTYQILPKAWKSDSQSELNEDVYSFTKTTVQRFKQAGVYVGMVQIGNEITKGMMGVKSNDYRAVWGDPVKSKKLTTFLSYASKGVRESAPNALVAVHIETPDPEKYGFIMDTLQKNGVDYDVLGSSYYPFYSRTANTPQMLAKVEALAANYGKYFAVMETSWVNTLQDADGTPNSIGDGRNVSAYDVSPQGQTNELTDLYKALGSQPNGLGAFYWEPAWIPVKAGWKNWEYNKQVADQFGTGWASKGAVGYYPNNKMYYNGKPAWGGSSWDNHGLFDDLGNPLQSLLTYKNMIGNGDVQTTRLRFVDENGKQLQNDAFVSTNIGEKLNVTAPAIAGYNLSNASAKQLNDVANEKGIKDITLIYMSSSEGETGQSTVKNPTKDTDKSGVKNPGKSVVKTPAKPANVASKLNQKVVLSRSEGYKIWQDFSWKKSVSSSSYKGKTLVAKYVYKHVNQKTSSYYSLYTASGKWVGYINVDAASKKVTKKATLKKTNKYNAWKSFKFNAKKMTAKSLAGKQIVARYEYDRYDGTTYYSIYNTKGQWLGYVNVKAFN